MMGVTGSCSFHLPQLAQANFQDVSKKEEKHISPLRLKFTTGTPLSAKVNHGLDQIQSVEMDSPSY